MIVEKEFLSAIRDLGINTYEAKLWTALLSRGIATAGELSDIANVPRSRSYDVLESLERKGFIVMKLGKPIKYIAVPPKEVIERVKKKIKNDADYQDKMLESMKNSEVVEQLNSIFKKGTDQIDHTEVTGIVRGKNNLESHIYSLMKNAKKSVSMILPSTKALQSMRKGLMKANKNGVKVKILTTEKASSDKLAQVKSSSKANLQLIVVDDKETLFMPLTESNPDFGVWVKGNEFSMNFVNLFNSPFY
ncbi:TrmB family transcriptional regulator [Nanoarchaeota archaeon]